MNFSFQFGSGKSNYQVDLIRPVPVCNTTSSIILYIVSINIFLEIFFYSTFKNHSKYI